MEEVLLAALRIRSASPQVGFRYPAIACDYKDGDNLDHLRTNYSFKLPAGTC